MAIGQFDANQIIDNAPMTDYGLRVLMKRMSDKIRLSVTTVAEGSCYLR